MAEDKNSTKIITGLVRFSYLNIYEPKAIEEGQDERFSVSLIISKDDTVTIAAYEAALAVALETGKVKLDIKDTSKLPAKFKLPLRDGDLERPDDEAYANSYFINANASADRVPPYLINDLNQDMRKTGDTTLFYSGCYGYASINLFPFNTRGNKGIAAGLNGLKFGKDGARLSGSSSAAEDFGAPESGHDSDMDTAGADPDLD